MSIASIVSRLQNVNNQLMAISSLRKLEDMPKACPCTHHRSNSVSRSPAKCSCSPKEKKKTRHCCSCRQQLKLCSCLPDKFQQKESEIEDNSKQRIEKSRAKDSSKGKMYLSDKEKVRAQDDSVDKEKAPDDRKFSTFRTAENIDDKPEIIYMSRAVSVASQAINPSTDKETLTSEKSDDEKKGKMQQLEKRNKELEELLKNMDCTMSCMKEEGDKQAACMKAALEKATADAKLASRSRDLAMDLAKQSRDQNDLVKASRDELANELTAVKCDYTKLECKCNDLKCKLKNMMEQQEKKNAEVDKFSKIQTVVKQREQALADEKEELENTVTELSDQIKSQKKRICELTVACARQRDLLRENENCISTKIAQLAEAEDKIQLLSCRCRQLQEKVENLECRWKEETIARENLQQVYDQRQDNCNCELQIKNKIINDQLETIKKLKKLLQDSEKMAHQAACEFESLRDELQCVKQSNKSLRMALDDVESRTSDETDACDRCIVLEAQINNLEEQKQKAVMTAKYAAGKLCRATTEYEQQLECEKKNTEYANDLIERQQMEIELLKKEILCVKEFRSRRSAVCMNDQ